MGLKESGLRASVRSVSTVVPAFFDVAITDTNSPINEGDVLVVDYSVDNTGDSFETQDIRLEIESVQEDADLDVSLSGGASDSGTLEWDTTGQDADTYEATVLSDDDSDTVTVEIPDAFFDVAIQSTNSPVEEGETLNVDYLVDNTGGVEDTQDIRLEIDNTQEDVDTEVTLDSDTSTTGTLQWDTTDESADTYSATVLSDDDSDSVTVEIASAIPDSVVHHYDASEDSRPFGSQSSIPDIVGNVDLDDGTQVALIEDGIDSNQSYETDGTDDYLRFDSNQISPPWTFMAVMRVRFSSRQMLIDHGGGGIRAGDGGIEFVDPENSIRYNSSGATSDEIEITTFDAVNNTFILVVEQRSNGATLRLRDPDVTEESDSIAAVDWNASVMDFFRGERDQRYLDSLQAEIVVADSEFDSELQDFEDNLIEKWGIN